MDTMDVKGNHSWGLTPLQAIQLQRQLALSVERHGEVLSPRYIAGIDISVAKDRISGRAAIIILSFPALEVVEMALSQGEIKFPYVPGLLSFREIPLILEACRKLTLIPDIIMVDGHGIAHPRRIGIASHLGLLLDIPSIGCAKSRLCGSYEMPPDEQGSYTNLVDKEEVVGVALRTKNRVNPLFVSIGYKISLENAIYWVMECCRGYRLPQPTRLAHLAAGDNLK